MRVERLSEGDSDVEMIHVDKTEMRQLESDLKLSDTSQTRNQTHHTVLQTQNQAQAPLRPLDLAPILTVIDSDFA